MTATRNGIFSIRNEQQENRVELLDFLRGAAMLLVLLHHSDAPFGAWLLAFHMPLMFVLSGYTMFRHQKKWKFWDYFKNRVMRLVVPYFLFEGLNLFVWCTSLILQGGWQDLSEAVTTIVTCVNTDAYTGYYGRLWFWPCMFVSDILFYFITKLYIYIYISGLIFGENCTFSRFLHCSWQHPGIPAVCFPTGFPLRRTQHLWPHSSCWWAFSGARRSPGC